MSESRGSTPSISAGETFIRIVPSVLLFLMLVWCCCRGEQPNSTRAETPESRQERRRRIESALIIKKVIAAPHRNNGGMAQRLTTSDRAYSSFLSAVRLPSKEPVQFSESANDVSLQHAEEGTCDSPHYKVHFAESTHEGCDDIPTTDEMTLHHDNEGAAAFQVLASSSTIHEASLQNLNRTDISWVPSASSSSVSEQVATSSAVTSPPTLIRRKSNIIARTISMSLRSLNANSAPYTSCDICLMDYQVGEEVCWSPNEACMHAFHKDCMLDWLLRNPLCPVCRRDYLDDKPPEQTQQENETREA